MNNYTKKSLELALKSKYLDKLLLIYGAPESKKRKISSTLKSQIKVAFKNKNKGILLEAALKLDKFPFDDPYVSSFRSYRYLINKNPINYGRISDRLLSYKSANNLIEISSTPKSASRQYGNSFTKWLKNIGFFYLDEEKFMKSTKGAFLKGNEKYLNYFVSEKFKIKLEKRPDFIFKKRNFFYVGEAKFITDIGGGQDNQVDKALLVAKINKKNIKGIAVLDGKIWFPSKNQRHLDIINSNNYILSALLLEEFLNQL